MPATHLRAPTLTAKQIARFWAKVAVGPPDTCWPWTRCADSRSHGVHRDRGGYGVVRFNYKNYRAHTIARWLATGEWSTDLNTLHNCPGQDNPSCCNPAHLYLGTQADNAKDSLLKEQRPKKHPAALILEIRRLHATGAFSLHELSRRFKMDRHYLADVINRKYWKHLT